MSKLQQVFEDLKNQNLSLESILNNGGYQYKKEIAKAFKDAFQLLFDNSNLLNGNIRIYILNQGNDFERFIHEMDQVRDSTFYDMLSYLRNYDSVWLKSIDKEENFESFLINFQKRYEL